MYKRQLTNKWYFEVIVWGFIYCSRTNFALDALHRGRLSLDCGEFVVVDAPGGRGRNAHETVAPTSRRRRACATPLLLLFYRRGPPHRKTAQLSSSAMMNTCQSRSLLRIIHCLAREPRAFTYSGGLQIVNIYAYCVCLTSDNQCAPWMDGLSTLLPYKRAYWYILWPAAPAWPTLLLILLLVYCFDARLHTPGIAPARTFSGTNWELVWGHVCLLQEKKSSTKRT